MIPSRLSFPTQATVVSEFKALNIRLCLNPDNFQGNFQKVSVKVQTCGIVNALSDGTLAVVL